MNNNQINGYDSQTGQPIYNQNTQQNNQVRYATLGERLSATLRDWLQMWWLVFAAFFILTSINVLFNMNGTDIDITKYIVIICIAFIVFGQPLYAMFADASSKHASKGKQKKNMHVLTEKGNYLTFGQSFMRMLLKYISIISVFGIIVSIFTICFSQKQQALHDLLLKQVVIKKI